MLPKHVETLSSYLDGVTMRRLDSITSSRTLWCKPAIQQTQEGGVNPFTGMLKIDRFDDEVHRELKHTGAGILSMANSGPNTNGSQFFLTFALAPWLDGKHTIFGRGCGGMEVLKRLGNVQTDKHDRPSTMSRLFEHTFRIVDQIRSEL